MARPYVDHYAKAYARSHKRAQASRPPTAIPGFGATHAYQGVRDMFGTDTAGAIEMAA